MNAENTSRVVQAFSRLAYPEIRKDFRPDCCIAASLIALKVFRHFGIRSQVVVARAIILNEAFVNRWRKEERFPSTEEIEQWHREDGSHSIGVGYGGQEGPKKWAGHLVTVVENKLLVDASIAQAERQRHNIYLPGVLVAPVTQKFLSGRGNFGFLHNRLMIAYEPDWKDRSYKRAPDWLEQKRTDPAVARIIHGIREEISSGDTGKTTEAE